MNQILLLQSSMFNLKKFLLTFIFIFLNVFCESVSAISAAASTNDGEGMPAICNPECSYGYNCINKSGKKTCVFSTTLIIIIVIVSIIGVCVIAAGIFFLCLCYCAAFNQDRLSRFFIKPKTASEVERDRIKYLEKIKKRPANPSNYFDEVRKKSKSRLEREGIIDETTRSTSGGNEKTLRKKTAPPPILGERKRNKSMLEIFPPATLTKTPKNAPPLTAADGNNNKRAISPAAGIKSIKSTAASPVLKSAKSPAISTKEKPPISPRSK